ncbi:uncharacterized protein M421DRAFT_203609 [Didymella exigua CBS 183.55]|uniref:Uncharacterized protein n=1 Tax=Didymella exigua CBS 183.55 TaxID=1150837 RepID=A0A6A5S1F5_9PLEO|nr:uncharacterized protein M421DRAFT_203609 [Didymella exigua CBS 183.55]KAF1933723.1 hypothetical protein M421DRAFT_203609 [Didymella exigua CBS 183.55]
MAIQWKESGAKDRLLAAVIAVSSNLDMNEVARLFGQGATYDAVEGQLRKAKKAAAALKEEATGRTGPANTPSRAKKTKNVNDSPVKTSVVKGARVSKPKKATTPNIKAELLHEDSMLFDAVINVADSAETEDEV